MISDIPHEDGHITTDLPSDMIHSKLVSGLFSVYGDVNKKTTEKIRGFFDIPSTPDISMKWMIYCLIEMPY